MGQFVDYRNKNKYQEGKDLIEERINAVLPEGASQEEMAKRIVELKLLKIAINTRFAESLFTFLTLVCGVSGFFCHTLFAVAMGCCAIAFFNFLRLELLKHLIRKLINENTN